MENFNIEEYIRELPPELQEKAKAQMNSLRSQVRKRYRCRTKRSKLSQAARILSQAARILS